MDPMAASDQLLLTIFMAVPTHSRRRMVGWCRVDLGKGRGFMTIGAPVFVKTATKRRNWRLIIFKVSRTIGCCSSSYRPITVALGVSLWLLDLEERLRWLLIGRNDGASSDPEMVSIEWLGCIVSLGGVVWGQGRWTPRVVTATRCSRFIIAGCTTWRCTPLSHPQVSRSNVCCRRRHRGLAWRLPELLAWYWLHY